MARFGKSHWPGRRERLRASPRIERKELSDDFGCDPRRVEEVGCHFDHIVRRIQERESAIKTSPQAAICEVCDLRMVCHAEGIPPQLDIVI